MADADEHVLEPMPFRIGVVDLVGDHRRQARLLGQRGELGDEPVVVGPRWWLSSTVKSPSAKWRAHVRAAWSAAARSPASRSRGTIPLRQPVRPMRWPRASSSAAATSGTLEDGELLLPGQVAAARQARERGVAVDVARQQDEVVAGDRSGVVLPRPAAARLRAAVRIVELAAAPGQADLVIGARDRQLEADDRAHGTQARLAGGIGLRLLGRLPGADRGIQAGVVGDGERRHAELGRAGDQLLGVAGTVEEAEVAVRVEFAVVVRRAHRTADDRTSVLFWEPRGLVSRAPATPPG